MECATLVDNYKLLMCLHSFFYVNGMSVCLAGHSVVTDRSTPALVQLAGMGLTGEPTDYDMTILRSHPIVVWVNGALFT